MSDRVLHIIIIVLFLRLSETFDTFSDDGDNSSHMKDEIGGDDAWRRSFVHDPIKRPSFVHDPVKHSDNVLISRRANDAANSKENNKHGHTKAANVHNVFRQQHNHITSDDGEFDVIKEAVSSRQKRCRKRVVCAHRENTSQKCTKFRTRCAKKKIQSKKKKFNDEKSLRFIRQSLLSSQNSKWWDFCQAQAYKSKEIYGYCEQAMARKLDDLKFRSVLIQRLWYAKDFMANAKHVFSAARSRNRSVRKYYRYLKKRHASQKLKLLLAKLRRLKMRKVRRYKISLKRKLRRKLSQRKKKYNRKIKKRKRPRKSRLSRNRKLKLNAKVSKIKLRNAKKTIKRIKTRQKQLEQEKVATAKMITKTATKKPKSKSRKAKRGVLKDNNKNPFQQLYDYMSQQSPAVGTMPFSENEQSNANFMNNMLYQTGSDVQGSTDSDVPSSSTVVKSEQQSSPTLILSSSKGDGTALPTFTVEAAAATPASAPSTTKTK